MVVPKLYRLYEEERVKNLKSLGVSTVIKTNFRSEARP